MDVRPTSAHSTLRSYFLGVVVAFTAVLCQWLIKPWVGDRVPFLFVLPALIFCAVALGRGPAFLVLVLGALNAALLAPPVGSVAMQFPQDIAALLAYVALGGTLVVYGGHIRRSIARAALTEKRLAMAQEDTGIGVFELDYQQGTAYISPSLCQILGQPRQEGPIPLDLWLNRLGAGHVEESRKAVEEHVRRGDLAYEREQRIARPDGQIRWLFHRVRLETDSSGKLERARGATVDITERKQLDLALLRAKAQLEQQLGDQQRLHAFTQKVMSAGDDVAAALRDLLALLVDLYGTPYGVISLCDPSSPKGHMVALCGLEDTPAGDLSTTTGRAQAVEAGTPAAALAASEFGYHAMLDAHQELMVSAGLRDLHSMPLVDGQGRIAGAVSLMFRELHEPSEREIQLGEIASATAAALVQRERARISAAKVENRFSVVMESSLVGFNIMSPVRDLHGAVVDFRWDYINPAAAKALGRDASELIGRHIGEVFPRVWTAPGLFQHYVEVVDLGVAREFEVRSTATGRGGWFNVVASPLQGSAAVWFADITARKLHEEAIQDADRRKDEFLATLAHELRNPLAPIRQCLRIISAPSATDAQRRWSESIIERQVNTMSLLLEDLLDVSRFGRGSLVLRKSRELLSEVLARGIETARPHIDAKRHRLEVESPEDALWVEIDPLRIAQVISNLLINAAKYTDPAGTIRLSAAVDDLGLRITVSDDGIGMSPNQIEAVFELFSQVPSAIEKSQGGLGIGLALARGLVELHGGTISAASAGPGLGSSFIVRLPRTCLGASTGSAAESRLLTKVADQESVCRRILIADDNIDAADSLAALLRLDGHEVHVAYDGAQALDLFSQVDPDAVLLDVAMPRVSGLQVARSIRADFAGRRAMLIAVTGFGQERDRRVAFESGFDHHLIKPVLPEDIEALLQQN